MKYFFDTEFHEHAYNLVGVGKVNTIDLISIGIVREDGESLYLIANDFDLKKAWENEWLNENVLKGIYEEMTSSMYENPPDLDLDLMKYLLKTYAKSREQIAKEVLAFVGEDEAPEFYAYYADYDWVVFCWLFGRMMELPEKFPMYCRDLKQMLDEKAICYEQPVEMLKEDCRFPPQENEHNALADAKWNKSLYEFLQNL